MTTGKTAVLGLGIIGSRAATRLLEAGNTAAWNRTPKGFPGEVSGVEEAVTGADLVCLYLKDALAVREVADRCLGAMTPGSTLANHSTVDLGTTRWLASECEARSLHFLDCPFTGSREASAAGSLVYYAAGDPALIDRFEPVLLRTGKAVIRCGGTGNATILKLVTNLISACTVQALAESLATATRHGIPAASLIDAIALNACGSPLAAMKLPGMAAGDFDTHFSLGNMLKDSRYVLDLAAKARIDTPAIRTVAERMEELCEAGYASLDYSALAAAYCEK